ncbi:MAG: adenylyltransferase/cytidyltransferase family protein [Puniceicoccales bacterium]|jgi:rfaE bifunctional protein nucleotidyltransferase chain/domain|nr:adenylyltransferase/cytidyltransferase family protein [Puniceicoccales bacterium]
MDQSTKILTISNNLRRQKILQSATINSVGYPSSTECATLEISHSVPHQAIDQAMYVLRVERFNLVHRKVITFGLAFHPKKTVISSMGASIYSFKDLCVKRNVWRRDGLRVGLTNGCFDLLHPGHIFLLERAAKFSDVLIVALNSDGSVRALKGPKRPIIPEHLRAYALSAIRWVDAVFIFDGTRVVQEICQLSPDVYVRAADRTVADLDSNELRALREIGAAIEFVPFLHGISTTEIVKRCEKPVA